MATRKPAIERLRERAAQAIAPKEGYLFAQIADDVAARRAQQRLSRPPRIDTLLRIAEALDCDLRVELKPR
jgi:hypothetical protein